MKAMVWTKYGPPDVLQLQEVEKPVPKDNEVLIRIHAATVTAGDCETRRFDMPVLFWLPIRLYMGLIKPRIKILGQEFAGEIETVGKDVKNFRKGDKVFAATDASFGACAEYKCLPEDGMLAIKPSNITFEEAAVIPVGGINALHFLKRAKVQSGQKLLIFGACGGIGTIALQVANSLGAEVTCVDSAEKLDVLRSLGADHVIDYTREDFTENGEIYDVIFDVVGKSSFSRTLLSLKNNGCYLLGNPGLFHMVRGLWTSWTSSRRVVLAMAGYKTEDLETLKEMIEVGEIKAVIDKRYSLEQVPDAHRYVESGQKKGNVVIQMLADNKTDPMGAG